MPKAEARCADITPGLGAKPGDKEAGAISTGQTWGVLKYLVGWLLPLPDDTCPPGEVNVGAGPAVLNPSRAARSALASLNLSLDAWMAAGFRGFGQAEIGWA